MKPCPWGRPHGISHAARPVTAGRRGRCGLEPDESDGVFPAQVDPQTFGLNLWLIIGAVVLAGGVFLSVLLMITAMRAGIWQIRRRRAQRRWRRPAGPPTARGLCDECGRVHERVAHLPTGARLCPACCRRRLEKLK